MSAVATVVGPTSAGDAAAYPRSRELSAERTLEAVQRELDEVREELDALRRRDDTLRFYMQRLDEELKLAARLQQDFLPRKLPAVGNVRFHTLFRPAGHVSGDLYDVMRLDEGHVGFYMADAVGHGMPAALLTMFLKQALVTKEIIATGGYRLLDPSLTMSRLNFALVEQNLSHATFATAVYGHIDTRTFEIIFSRGGHPSPVLMSRDGQMRTVTCEGSLLGIFPSEQFGQTRLKLQAGERLFIYSDGIELAFGDSEEADTARWREELSKRAHLPSAQILQEFADHVDRFWADPNRKKDDLTLIVIDALAAT